MKSNKGINRFGQSLVELILAVALASILLPALLTGLVSSREGKAQQDNRLTATTYLKEAVEAVRTVREAGWSGIAINGTYYPQRTPTSWTLTLGMETLLTTFNRYIVISDAQRDQNGALVASGGTPDHSTKRIQVVVSWNQPFSYQVSQTLYLSRFLQNDTYSQTTETEFLGGVTTNTTITNISGGEVVLGAGGGGSWCDPNLTITALDLPKNGVANAIWAVEGHVSAGTGENASGVSYARVNVTDTDPPVATIQGTFDGYKTNDIWTDGDYTYIATDNNSKEIVILNISQNPPTESGYFNIPGNTNSEGVFVSGNYGYAISTSKMYIFDVSSKSGSRPQVGNTFTLLGEGTSLTVKGNYAYVTIDGATELQIIDISNPNNIQDVGSASVAGHEGIRVYVNESETRAYLVTERSDTQKEFFIIDVSTKTGSLPTVGSYEGNGMNPKSITAVPGNKAIVVGTGGEEYQVIDITNETNPVRCGGLNVDTGVNGISSVLEADGDVYSYIITGDSTTELKIIEGGPGGQFSNSGMFESSTFDAGSSVAFNRFWVTANTPPQTTLTYQVAVADAISGSCSGVSFAFVGPDGTDSTSFTQGSPISTSDDGSGFENPGRCLRYRMNFSTTEIIQSPTFYDITFNYSL